jgi:hypothetical protein
MARRGQSQGHARGRPPDTRADKFSTELAASFPLSPRHPRQIDSRQDGCGRPTGPRPSTAARPRAVVGSRIGAAWTPSAWAPPEAATLNPIEPYSATRATDGDRPWRTSPRGRCAWRRSSGRTPRPAVPTLATATRVTRRRPRSSMLGCQHAGRGVGGHSVAVLRRVYAQCLVGHADGAECGYECWPLAPTGCAVRDGLCQQHRKRADTARGRPGLRSQGP